jgi:hemerythrin
LTGYPNGDGYLELPGGFNILYDHMKAGKSGVVIESLLASLIDYTKVHFKTEEDLFAKYRYPQTVPHVAEHDKFVETVGKFNQDYAKKEVGLSIEVLDFLTSRLRDHILIQDKAYGPFLKQQGQ